MVLKTLVGLVTGSKALNKALLTGAAADTHCVCEAASVLGAGSEAVFAFWGCNATSVTYDAASACTPEAALLAARALGRAARAVEAALAPAAECYAAAHYSRVHAALHALWKWLAPFEYLLWSPMSPKELYLFYALMVLLACIFAVLVVQCPPMALENALREAKVGRCWHAARPLRSIEGEASPRAPSSHDVPPLNAQRRGGVIGARRDRASPPLSERATCGCYPTPRALSRRALCRAARPAADALGGEAQGGDRDSKRSTKNTDDEGERHQHQSARVMMMFATLMTPFATGRARAHVVCGRGKARRDPRSPRRDTRVYIYVSYQTEATPPLEGRSLHGLCIRTNTAIMITHCHHRRAAGRLRGNHAPTPPCIVFTSTRHWSQMRRWSHVRWRRWHAALPPLDCAWLRFDKRHQRGTQSWFVKERTGTPPAVGPWCRRNSIPRRSNLDKNQTWLLLWE